MRIVSRRVLLKGSLAAAGSAAAATLLAACGSGGATDTPKPVATTGATASTTAATALDKSKRFDLHQQMLEQYESEAPGTTLYIPKEIYAMKASIDWTPYPLYYMDLRAYNLKIK